MKRCIFCRRCPGRCFFQHKLRCIICSRLPGSVMVNTCIFCRRWHGICLVNTCGDTFCVLACMVNTCWDAFRVLAGIAGVRSTQIQIHFVSPLACEGFCQHKLTYNLCPSWHQHRSIFCPRLCLRWHLRGLVNKFLDAFCYPAGIGEVWSKKVEMLFFCSRWYGKGYGQQK